jgi:hypothetical protein
MQYQQKIIEISNVVLGFKKVREKAAIFLGNYFLMTNIIC